MAATPNRRVLSLSRSLSGLLPWGHAAAGRVTQPTTGRCTRRQLIRLRTHRELQSGQQRRPSAIRRPQRGPGDELTDLTAAPASGPASICEDVYFPGERLLIGAGGILPHTPVRVFVESRGVPGAEQELASLRSDGTGAIASKVEIPLQATGFLPRGAHAALIFLAAIGLGADAVSHAAAVQMAGLAPRGSPCAITPQ